MKSLRLQWDLNYPITGLILGWLIGMLCWTGIVLSFGPSVVVTDKNGQVVSTPDSTASRITYAPIGAIPWAVTCLVIGLITPHPRNLFVPLCGMIGMICGGFFVAITEPHDGWLFVSIPVFCL